MHKMHRDARAEYPLFSSTSVSSFVSGHTDLVNELVRVTGPWPGGRASVKFKSVAAGPGLATQTGPRPLLPQTAAAAAARGLTRRLTISGHGTGGTQSTP